MAEKQFTGRRKLADPVVSASERIWNRQQIGIMAGYVAEEDDALYLHGINLPDSERGIFKMMESSNVWRNVIMRCKSPVAMHELIFGCSARLSMLSTTLGDALEEALKHDSFIEPTAARPVTPRTRLNLELDESPTVPEDISDATTAEVEPLLETTGTTASKKALADTSLREIVRREVGNLDAFGANMFALGCIRGMQFGRELDSKNGGHIARLLKHAAVRRLLLQEPNASNLAICRALDKVEGLPWPKLRKLHGCWERAVGHQSVRTLITNSRRAAWQDAAFHEFLTVAGGVGDEASITNQFRPKKYGLATARVTRVKTNVKRK